VLSFRCCGSPRVVCAPGGNVGYAGVMGERNGGESEAAVSLTRVGTSVGGDVVTEVTSFGGASPLAARKFCPPFFHEWALSGEY